MTYLNEHSVFGEAYKAQNRAAIVALLKGAGGTE